MTEAVVINDKIDLCCKNFPYADLKYPKTLKELQDFQDFVHITWTSPVLGIMDDMYIQTYLNTTTSANFTVMNIMS